MKLILLFLIALWASALRAETYYVDATLGNDNNNGKSATVASTNVGPWKTLAKASATSFQPGDQVLLKCGETWRETLKLASSGTASQPITIGAYPQSCQNKPIIDGANPITAQSWTYQSNGIYIASLASNSTVLNTTFNGSKNAGTLDGWTKQSSYQDGMIWVSSICEVANDRCLRYLSGQATSNNLLLSPKFTLQAGRAYELSFSLTAPKGLTLRVAIKRTTTPYEPVGLQDSVAGTGAWASYRLPFIATASLGDARIEIDVLASYKDIGLDNAKLAATLAMAQVNGLFNQGKAINIAHHPNRGYDPLNPTSLYLTIADTANRVTDATGRVSSTYLTTGADLQLPTGASLTAGTGVRSRINAWMLEDRKITYQSGNRLYIDQPTSYPVEKGWGYYLYGNSWMLDEPGEWHFDSGNGTLLVRMPDDLPPGDRVTAAQREAGIDISNRSHVTIDGIAIRNVATGVNMRGTTNVAVRNLTISDTLGKGVDALQSTDGRVENSRFERTAGDAIWAANGPASSTRFSAQGNIIKESGIALAGTAMTHLPIKNDAAIMVGDDATVTGNQIDGAGYIGIRAFSRAYIANNLIENACAVLDDCGAIYVNGANNASVIQGNILRNIAGALEGKPAGHGTQGQGIFLDDHTSQVLVTNNAIENADHGIQLHNAATNVITDNTLYGNRKAQLWLQEQTNVARTQGDLHDNQVTGNQLFPLPDATAPALLMQSVINTTAGFGAFDHNIYSTLSSAYMAKEDWPGGSASYTFPAWQAARTSDGAARNLDPNGREARLAGEATYRIAGGNLVVNGDLRSGITGWSNWNQTAPYGIMNRSRCAVGYCIQYTAGASPGLLISPNFSVAKDQWYRVSFDYRTSTDNQPVSILVRRGGGGLNLYENLAASDEQIVGGRVWKRHSYAFKALKTVNKNDPVTLDMGARVDFQNLLPGQSIALSNLEVVPITPTAATLRSHLLTNPSIAPIYLDCPEAASESELCGQYLRFSDGDPLDWPLALDPWSAEIVHVRETILIDHDLDGVEDQQDLCPSSPSGLAVNAAGCALGQVTNP